jgi:hypothetical protein
MEKDSIVILIRKEEANVFIIIPYKFTQNMFSGIFLQFDNVYVLLDFYTLSLTRFGNYKNADPNKNLGGEGASYR